MAPNYTKLKTNLRLCVNRLKLLEKKKTEMALKSRKEIADYIAAGKEDRARIRVEHIVREDYLVEAMEMIEMYCDLLLARMGLIQQMKAVDAGLEEAITSILWVTPRLQSDIAELKVVSDIFGHKYGKPFVQAAREDSLQTVNERLKIKLGVEAPPKILVEKYMIEIAKSHNIPFEPDMAVMKEDEVYAAEAMLIDLGGKDGGGQASAPPGRPPDPPTAPGFGGAAGGPPGGGGGMAYPPQQMMQGGPPQPQPFAYPPPQVNMSPYPEKSHAGPPVYNNQQPPPPPKQAPVVNPSSYGYNEPPSYNSATNDKPPPGTDNLGLPDLPQVPSSSFPKLSGDENVGGASDDVDFDDLTRRFEELKKKK